MKKIHVLVLIIFMLFLNSCASTPKGNNGIIGQWVFDQDNDPSILWDFRSNSMLYRHTSQDGKITASLTVRYRIEGNKIILPSEKIAYFFDLSTPNVLKLKQDPQTVMWEFFAVDQREQIRQKIEKGFKLYKFNVNLYSKRAQISKKP